jgi:hypothetical protein
VNHQAIEADSFGEHRLAHFGGANPAAGFGFGGFGVVAKGGFGAKPAAGGFGAGKGAFDARKLAGGFGGPAVEPADSWEPQLLDVMHALGGGAWAESGSWTDVKVQRNMLRPGQMPIWDVLFADRDTSS